MPSTPTESVIQILGTKTKAATKARVKIEGGILNFRYCSPLVEVVLIVGGTGVFAIASNLQLNDAATHHLESVKDR